jgi:hypothetical protein
VQPAFFSRDANQKRKRGRPRKTVRGRPKGKGSSAVVGDSSVTRQLFRDSEQPDSTRDSPGRLGVVIPLQTPTVASGIPSPIFSTAFAHADGDLTPIVVGIGAPQGTSHTAQRGGLQSPSSSLFVAPEVGLSGSPFGPSHSYIAKKVISSGKMMGVSFMVDDTLEESRLVALEVRDSAAKAAMGADRSVP